MGRLCRLAENTFCAGGGGGGTVARGAAVAGSAGITAVPVQVLLHVRLDARRKYRTRGGGAGQRAQGAGHDRLSRIPVTAPYGLSGPLVCWRPPPQRVWAGESPAKSNDRCKHSAV